MTKILIDARQSGTSTGRYVDKLVENLHKLSHNFEFELLAQSHRVQYLRSVAPTFKITQSDFKQFSFGEQFGLKKQIKSLNPDLVHFTTAQQPVFYRGTVVTSMLDLTPLRFKNPLKNSIKIKIDQQLYKYLNIRVAKKSKTIICISEYVKNDVMNLAKIKPEKITVTYNAADKITEKPEVIESLENTPFIMYVGRPQPHKNLGRLIDAFKILRESYPDLKLVLAGKKDVLFLQHEKRVGELGLSDSVIFTDFISEGQLRWLYENCQAYVFPSLSEGFGLPGLEAMVHGAPVISSNATCLPEVYDDAAYYFNPLDEEEMAEVISHVLDDKELRKSLIKKGFEQSKKYSWQRMAEQTLSVYKKTLG